MKIWILAKKENFEKYNVSRFIEESSKSHVECSLVSPEDFDIIVTKEGKRSIHFKGHIVDFPDCLIPRMGSGTTYFGLALIRHLENQGVLVLNPDTSISQAKDKLATVQILDRNNLPIPKTMLAKFPLDFEIVKKEFDFPIVIKTVSGSFGKGVFLCENSSKLEDVMDLVEASTDAKANIILQEFVSSSKGRDIRVIVVGGRPIGAMLREAKEGYKANYSKGAAVKEFELNPAIEWLASESARALGLEIAGVDILFDGDNYKVCEVNSAPGFEGFEKATRLNVVKEIFEYVKVRLGNT